MPTLWAPPKHRMTKQDREDLLTAVLLIVVLLALACIPICDSSILRVMR
jgi:hypothetical protein